MSTRYATGRIALGICDRCGFQYKLRELKMLVVNDAPANLKVCGECWEPDHPHNKLGKYPVYDPQALQDPRPDTQELAASRAHIVPVTFVACTIWVGRVTASGS